MNIDRVTDRVDGRAKGVVFSAGKNVVFILSTSTLEGYLCGYSESVLTVVLFNSTPR